MDKGKIEFRKTNMSEMDRRLLQSHDFSLQQHSKALAAHCECLAMNAENMWAAILNEEPKYLEKDYRELMVKWGLISKEGMPMV